MPVITYRRLDSNYEPRFNSQDALSDLEAVAQAIHTRLLLFLGEWWEDQNEGTPYWQSILGEKKNLQQASLLIQQRIQQTPFVLRVFDVQSTYDSNQRTLKFSCTVDTQFGSLVVSNIPSSQGLTS